MDLYKHWRGGVYFQCLTTFLSSKILKGTFKFFISRERESQLDFRVRGWLEERGAGRSVPERGTRRSFEQLEFTLTRRRKDLYWGSYIRSLEEEDPTLRGVEDNRDLRMVVRKRTGTTPLREPGESVGREDLTWVLTTTYVIIVCPYDKNELTVKLVKGHLNTETSFVTIYPLNKFFSFRSYKYTVYRPVSPSTISPDPRSGPKECTRDPGSERYTTMGHQDRW